MVKDKKLIFVLSKNKKKTTDEYRVSRSHIESLATKEEVSTNTVLEQIFNARRCSYMEQKELMITILRILLQKGTITKEVFDKSIEEITSNT